MKTIILLCSLPMILSACASKPKLDEAMIEKYPFCYHKLIKLANKCIDLNESGKHATALELENAAFPGQYSNQ